MAQVSVVIPTRNEEASIGLVLAQVQAAFAASRHTCELLVVDTLSTDRTVALAEAKGARVVPEDRWGYGRAYKTGFAEARGEVIATLDADATYPAEVIPHLVDLLETEGLDFLSGERMSRLERGVMEPHHLLGNAVLNGAVRLLFGVRLRDSQSGMWVFRRAILQALEATSDGMPFSEEIKLEVVAKGFRFAEVPIAYRRRVGEVKIRSWADGWANLGHLVRRRFRSGPRPGGGPPSRSG